ncbi:unnamed protein product [Linum trigynum]|uniref:Uncharacterized protein n=1 Tax=Linum trigynum TaxID=586398 RepID=A0AAV2G4T1_9ROSI
MIEKSNLSKAPSISIKQPLNSSAHKLRPVGSKFTASTTISSRLRRQNRINQSFKNSRKIKSKFHQNVSCINHYNDPKVEYLKTSTYFNQASTEQLDEQINDNCKLKKTNLAIELASPAASKPPQPWKSLPVHRIKTPLKLLQKVRQIHRIQTLVMAEDGSSEKRGKESIGISRSPELLLSMPHEIPMAVWAELISDKAHSNSFSADALS